MDDVIVGVEATGFGRACPCTRAESGSLADGERPGHGAAITDDAIAAYRND